MVAVRCIMTPQQKASYDAILGMAHRVAVRIAGLPQDQREGAIKMARNTIMECAPEYGITDPKLIEICSEGVAVVLREMVASGNPGGGLA
jgi:hypothetical protein